VAPAGSVTVIWLFELITKGTTAPLSWTEVTPLKFAPFRITVAPTGPLVGEKPVNHGVAEVVTVNVLEVAIPCEVWIVSGPVVAPFGTRTTKRVQLWLVSVVTGTPLKRTMGKPGSASDKAVPVIVTEVPADPVVVEILLIAGAGAV
jgi:hypothetical protein